MDAYQAYKEALKMAKDDFSRRQERGLDPYLDDLDPFLSQSRTVKEGPAETKEIFTSLIIGTRTSTRAQSFAHNFMPLLDPSSEFAAKWISLYTSQNKEGIHEPILVYELFGRYFVEEGNKRTSVCKFLKTPMIQAKVRHLRIEAPDTPVGKLYQEYLNFQQLSGIDSLLMSSPESYQKLLLLLKADKELSSKEKEDLISLFKSFWAAYSKLDLKHPLLIGDAFLIYLETFGLPAEKSRPLSQIEKELETIRPRLESKQESEEKILTSSSVSEKSSLFSLFSNPLRIAFINASDEKNPWSADHINAIEKVLDRFQESAQIQVYNGINTRELFDKAMKEAIDQKTQLIFTTHPSMLQRSNLYAAQNRNIKILNSSLKVQSGPVRTYYTRDFEGLFLMGLCAGMYTRTDKIIYLADYPIDGEAAKINAFAIGVAMVNPYAKVYLDWSTIHSSAAAKLPEDADMLYIDNQDLDMHITGRKHFGLFDIAKGEYKRIAHLHINWEAFYIPIISSVLNHTYSSDEKKNVSGISYWWGLSNSLFDVKFWPEIKGGSMHLIHYLEKQIKAHNFDIFDTRIPAFSGLPHDEKGRVLLENVLSLNILVDNIVGSFPSLDQLSKDVKDQIPWMGLERLKNEE